MRKKKLLSILLAMVMLVGLMPTTAMADTIPDDALPTAVNGVITLNNNVKLGSSWYVGDSNSVNNAATIDLNGFDIDLNGNSLRVPGSGGTGKTLIIKDSKAEGKIRYGYWGDGGEYVVSDTMPAATDYQVLKGGIITGGSSADNRVDGSAVYANQYATLYLKSGNIVGNKCSGVFFNSGANFYMTGGSISGNKTEKYGGGVNFNGQTMEMTGGSISGNKATQYGGGVNFCGSTLNMAGDVVVNGNMTGDAANNVYLFRDYGVVTITGNLGANSRIGITTKDTAAEGLEVAAFGYTATEEQKTADASKIVSDNTEFTTKLNDEDKIVLTAVQSGGNEGGNEGGDAVTPEETKYDVWIGGEQVTSANLSGEGWAYDYDSKTLKLEDYTNTDLYNFSRNYYGAIYAEQDLNIVLKGENKLHAAGEHEIQDGIKAYGITISGDGSLEIIGANTSNDGSGIYAGSIKILENAKVTVKRFGYALNGSVTIGDETDNTDNPVVVAYGNKNGSLGSVTVNSGTAELIGAGKAVSGSVTNNASGKEVIAGENGVDATVTANISDAKYVRVAAENVVKNPVYLVTVTDEVSPYNDSYSEDIAYEEGTTVTLTAGPAPSGKVFDAWVVTPDTVSVTENTFTMPASNVAVKATYKTAPVGTYTVSVTNGTADKTACAASETITLTADAAPSGKVFDKWVVVSDNVVLADENATTTTFTMPAENVEVEATYKDAPAESTSGKNHSSKKYDVKADKDTENGSVSISNDRSRKGSTVTITVTPDEGYVVDTVTVTDKNGNKIAVKDNGDGTYTFRMPASSVEIDTEFKKAGELPAETEKPVEEAKEIILTIGSTVAMVDDMPVVNDTAPVIRGERTVLPIRFVAEELGATVEWNEAEAKVTITKGDLTIEIFIGQPFALVNGDPVELDASAFIENDRTYLPLRFIAEYLGAEVIWDGNTNTITILSEK